jgi:hypothetical protein
LVVAAAVLVLLRPMPHLVVQLLAALVHRHLLQAQQLTFRVAAAAALWVELVHLEGLAAEGLEAVPPQQQELPELLILVVVAAAAAALVVMAAVLLVVPA